MTSREWDAYKSLGITSRESSGATCLGTNRYGKRCRWDIEHSSFQAIRAVLDEMERRPPKEALSSLDHLARLCLSCEFHPSQRWDVISRWKSAIAEAVREYDKGVELKRKIAELESQSQSQSGSQEALQGLHDEIARLKYQLTVEQTARSSSEQELGKHILQSNDLQQRLRDEIRKFETASAERDSLFERVASLNSDLTHWKTKGLRTERSLEVEFSRATNFEKISLEAERDRDNSALLSRRVVNLETFLKEEKQMSSQQSAQLAEAAIERLGSQKAYTILKSELEQASHKQEILVNELSLERAKHTDIRQALGEVQQDLVASQSSLDKAHAKIAASLTENERLRMSVAEGQKQYIELIIELRREMKSTEDNLSSTKRALDEAQTEVRELRTSAGEGENRFSADIAEIKALTRQIDFYRKHPFKAFFFTMIGNFSRRPMAFLDGLRVARFNTAIQSAASGVEPVDS